MIGARKRSGAPIPSPSLDLGPVVVVSRGPSRRDGALDAFRGAAIVLMILDHVSLAVGLGEYRMTLGRLAMPMFFLLAGHLARTPRWRHAGIAGLGLLLPVVVPWIDSPNVLVWWAMGVVLLWSARLAGFPVVLVAVLGFTVAANGWAAGDSGSYDPYALWGLMAIGAGLSRAFFGWAGDLPAWVAGMGRHPVGWYVGHLLVLQLVLEVAT